MLHPFPELQLRGSVVVFTAIFSVVFLKRKQYAYHWIGVGLVLIGTLIVGLQSYVCGDGGASSSSGGRAMVGNVLIIAAQVIVAVQMVVEEKLIGSADLNPMQVVGMVSYTKGYPGSLNEVQAARCICFGLLYRLHPMALLLFFFFSTHTGLFLQEGFFGFTTLSAVLVIMYFVPSPSFLCTTAPHCDHFEDTYDAFVNME